MAEMDQKYGPASYGDEINLVDLWSILMRRKGLIVVVFLITLLGSVVYLVLAQPVYESRVVVQVGQVGQVDEVDEVEPKVSYVEDLDVFKQRLLAEHAALAAVEAPRKGAQNVFTLTVRQGDKDVAGKQLNDIVEKLLLGHRAIYDKIAGPLQGQQQSLAGQLHDFIKQRDDLTTLIERLKQSEPTLAALLLTEKTGLSRMIVEIEEKLVSLQTLLSAPNTLPSRVLGTQVTPNKPREPKKKMIMALGLILGAMLGVFAAFFAEFLKKAKDSQASSQ
ncbi:MAG: Wzz/FepE/Etk N-terminal domain-containing protein [Desulfurivibrionaceae bacterium]|nr:Wzz/FepE/Etk N-terminal domain-containing protein [Desulfurivibrionaceae bacterium]